MKITEQKQKKKKVETCLDASQSSSFAKGGTVGVPYRKRTEAVHNRSANHATSLYPQPFFYGQKKNSKFLVFFGGNLVWEPPLFSFSQNRKKRKSGFAGFAEVSNTRFDTIRF